MEPRRRFGGLEFRRKIKEASNYKRAFNPTLGFSLKIFSRSSGTARAIKIVGIALVLIVAYYFTISSTLVITDVTIKGNRQVSTQEIQNVLNSNDSRFFLIKKNNFFLMTRGRVSELLTTAIPTIKGIVSFNRTWPNKLSIEIVEHTPGFVIESNGSYFLVNDAGVVVSQIESPQKLLIAHDQLVENFSRGENLPNQKLAPFVLSMNKSWSSKMTEGIESVKFPGKSSTDVQFITKAGWSVFFDTTRPVSVQLSSLAVILSKEIGQPKLPKLVYIDLRISKWAYYCLKESSCQQKIQPAITGTETNVK